MSSWSIAIAVYGVATIYLLLKVLAVLVEIQQGMKFFREASNVEREYLRDLVGAVRHGNNLLSKSDLRHSDSD